MHGPTFMANPLACAIANASIDLLLASPWQEQIRQNQQSFAATPAALPELGRCGRRQGQGGIGVLELEKAVNMPSITRRFVDKGVWIRPFGKLVYVMPPYVISDEELGQFAVGHDRSCSRRTSDYRLTLVAGTDN